MKSAIEVCMGVYKRRERFAVRYNFIFIVDQAKVKVCSRLRGGVRDAMLDEFQVIFSLECGDDF